MRASPSSSLSPVLSLPWVKIAWVVIVLFLLAVYLLALPHMFAHGELTCDSLTCSNDQLSTADLLKLQQAGLSQRFYAVYTTSLDILYTLIFSFIAAVIFWRRPDDRMAVYASLALIMFAVAVFVSPLDDLKWDTPALRLPLQILQLIAGTAFVSFFYLFPDGRFIPSWTIWLVPLVAIREGMNLFAPNLPGVDLGLVLEVLSVVFAQIYRYRRVSTPVQRQQTKWAVYGLVTAFTFVIVFLYGGFLLFGRLAGLGFIIFPTVVYLVTLVLPLSFGMAILRSHLWDIDILIRRTLLYATLTLALGLVYFGSVVLLQQVAVLITGQRESPVVIVLSTLAIAALFTPLRRRVQNVIDRRFFRQRYDAEQILTDFRSITQTEMDLTRLTSGLVEMVEKSVQPDGLSLWLRASPGPAKRGE